MSKIHEAGPALQPDDVQVALGHVGPDEFWSDWMNKAQDTWPDAELDEIRRSLLSEVATNNYRPLPSLIDKDGKVLGL